MAKRRAPVIATLVVLAVVATALWLGFDRSTPRSVARNAKSAASPGASANASTSPNASASPSPSATTSPSASGDSSYLAVLPQGPPTFTATFNGSQLDSSLWARCYPWNNTAAGCTNFGTREVEWYLPAQDQVAGGVLRLIAQRELTTGQAKDGSTKTYGCRSGLVTTNPGFDFRYGFLQVKARIPHAAGLWSALWLAPANLQWPPEMDMIESWGVDHESAAFFHAYPTSRGYVKALIPVSLTSSWQTFSLYWTSSEMEFFVGTTKIMTITRNVPHQKMYFIANVAEYLPPAPGNCSGELDLRSLKYWAAPS